MINCIKKIEESRTIMSKMIDAIEKEDINYMTSKERDFLIKNYYDLYEIQTSLQVDFDNRRFNKI